MALPRKLKALNLFNDANSFQGVVTSVTLPKLARKLDAYRGGGMNGAAHIDNGLEDDALDMEWSIGGIDELVLSQWGTTSVPLRFLGSYQRDDTAEEIAVEIEVRGSAVSTRRLISVKPNRAKTPKPKSPPNAPTTNSAGTAKS